MLGTSELLVILCVFLLLFGGKRLPELARSLGKALREFKSALNEERGRNDVHLQEASQEFSEKVFKETLEPSTVKNPAPPPGSPNER